MNVTTLPVGATGQFLEGVAVSTGVRESVILTSPSDANAFAEIVSSQPINFYGLPVWLQGTPSVGISGNVTMVGTTTPNIVSSIPYWVSQSSAPWAFSEVASTAGGTNATSIALQANLNTTVVKASAGQVYGIFGSNIGSSNVFVRLYNISTAALTIASSAVPLLVFGMPVSTSPLVLFDMAVAFNAGISLITQQQPYTASNAAAPLASTATITVLYK